MSELEKTAIDETADKDIAKESLPQDEIPLRFRFPSKSPSVYSTHLVVQDTSDEVVMSFFELIRPILPREMSEEDEKKLRETGVVAECVSRVTVAKHKFPSFAQAIAEAANRIVEEFEEMENANNQPNNTENK